jgi:hypothetical protein
MERYGPNWALIAEKVRSRNITQVRSHAQKFLRKKEKNQENTNLMIGPKESRTHRPRLISTRLEEAQKHVPHSA